MPVVIGVGMITGVITEDGHNLGHRLVDVTNIRYMYYVYSTHFIVYSLLLSYVAHLIGRLVVLVSRPVGSFVCWPLLD